MQLVKTAVNDHLKYKVYRSWSLMFLCSHALRHDGAGHRFPPKGQRRRKVVTMRSSNAVEIVLGLYGVHWYKTNSCKYFQFLSYLDTLGLWKPQLMLFSQRCYLPRVDTRHNHPFPLRLLKVDIVIFFLVPLTWMIVVLWLDCTTSEFFIHVMISRGRPVVVQLKVTWGNFFQHSRSAELPQTLALVFPQ